MRSFFLSAKLKRGIWQSLGLLLMASIGCTERQVSINTLSLNFENLKPTVTLTSTSANSLNTSFTVTAEFSESVTSFVSEDITVTNGTASAFSGSGTTYTFTVTPTTQGLVTVAVPAGVAQDSAGNTNTAATNLTRTFDSVAPTITGLASDSNWVKSKTWNWGCNETCTYSYVVDTSASTTPGGVYSATTTATQSTGSGTYYLHVQAKDEAGNVSTVYHVSAKLDNTLPTTPVIASYSKFSNILTNSPVITFTSGTDSHSGIDKHEARIVRVSDDTVIKSWATFTSGNTITATLDTNTEYRVEVRAVDKAGNISTAQGEKWMADQTPPSTPTGLAVGAIPQNLTSTPPLSWAASTDTGGSGVDYYEVQILQGATVIKDWMVLQSGQAVSGLNLTPSTNYIFKVRARDKAGNVSGISANLTWTTINDPCPTGYILVPKLAGYTNEDFCVAKYEMKNVSNIAVSQAAGNPWVSINRDGARAQCTNIGGKYDLISNAQWQTVARNIETVKENWSSGTVGTGNLARGWSASTSYGDTYTNTAVAPLTGPTCLYNTAANTCGTTGTHLYRRTHTLTNGKEIWDFSGNVWEWTRDNYADLGVNPAISAAWQELSGLSDTNKALFSSADGTRNSAQGIGQAYGGSVGAVLRGGDWHFGAVAGVFTVSLIEAPSNTNTSTGFRCVFVP